MAEPFYASLGFERIALEQVRLGGEVDFPAVKMRAHFSPLTCGPSAASIGIAPNRIELEAQVAAESSDGLTVLEERITVLRSYNDRPEFRFALAIGWQHGGCEPRPSPSRSVRKRGIEAAI